MAALAETMGHKDWKTTMQYTHVWSNGGAGLPLYLINRERGREVVEAKEGEPLA